MLRDSTCEAIESAIESSMAGRQPDARVYCDPNEIEDALVYTRCHETWQDDVEIDRNVWDVWGDDWRIRMVVPAVRTYEEG